MRHQKFIAVLMAGLVGGFLSWMPEADALQLTPDKERPPADGQYLSRKLTIAGQDRSYAIYIPTTYRAEKRVPLVVVLHGTSKKKKVMNRIQPGIIRATWVPGAAVSRGSRGHNPLLVPVFHIPSGGGAIISYGSWDRMAENEGFIAMAPNSLGHAFNDGSGRGLSSVETIDDTGFIDAAIDDMLQHYAIERTRIYMVGLSSGGSMAQSMAIERPEKIAAFAAVMGHLWTKDQAPAPTRPMLLLFGDSDWLNPVDGGPVKYPPPIHLTLDKLSHLRTAELWSKRMGCGERHEPDEGRAVRVFAWGTCRDGAELLLYVVRDLGHHWPGGVRPSKKGIKFAGPYTDAIDATELIWDFFSQHRLR